MSTSTRKWEIFESQHVSKYLAFLPYSKRALPWCEYQTSLIAEMNVLKDEEGKISRTECICKKGGCLRSVKPDCRLQFFLVWYFVVATTSNKDRGSRVLSKARVDWLDYLKAKQKVACTCDKSRSCFQKVDRKCELLLKLVHKLGTLPEFTPYHRAQDHAPRLVTSSTSGTIHVEHGSQGQSPIEPLEAASQVGSTSPRFGEEVAPEQPLNASTQAVEYSPRLPLPHLEPSVLLEATVILDGASRAPVSDPRVLGWQASIVGSTLPGAHDQGHPYTNTPSSRMLNTNGDELRSPSTPYESSINDSPATESIFVVTPRDTPQSSQSTSTARLVHSHDDGSSQTRGRHLSFQNSSDITLEPADGRGRIVGLGLEVSDVDLRYSSEELPSSVEFAAMMAYCAVNNNALQEMSQLCTNPRYD